MVDAALTAPAPGFHVLYGISANTRAWWDLEPGRALGYEPQDDAEEFAARSSRPRATARSGVRRRPVRRSALRAAAGSLAGPPAARGLLRRAGQLLAPDRVPTAGPAAAASRLEGPPGLAAYGRAPGRPGRPARRRRARCRRRPPACAAPAPHARQLVVDERGAAPSPAPPTSWRVGDLEAHLGRSPLLVVEPGDDGVVAVSSQT